MQIKIKAVVPGHGIILHLPFLNNRLQKLKQNELCNIVMDLNSLSVFPQGVAVSDVRRELMF